MAKAQESLEEREKEGASIKEEPYIEIKKYGKNRGYICRVQEIHTKKAHVDTGQPIDKLCIFRFANASV